MFNLLNTWLEAGSFIAEVQSIIALRMIRLASGGPDAAVEARQMILEKVSAFGEAQVAIITALANGSRLDTTAVEVYEPYRRCVRANCRRLGS